MKTLLYQKPDHPLLHLRPLFLAGIVSLFAAFAHSGLRGDPQVDVLIVYTEAVEDYFGSRDGVEAYVNAIISSTNQAYENSEIHGQVSLAHLAKVNYEESNDMGVDLSRLRVTNDNYLDEVHSLRNAWGADLVCLLRMGTTSGVAGIAYLLPSSSGMSGLPNFGFSVVAVETSLVGAVFAHELGHNMGAHHARNDPQNTNGGYFTHSNGHRFTSQTFQQYRTIMAYSPGSRIYHFSNPSVLYAGTPTGMPISSPQSADNTNTLNFTMPIVAGYRQAPSPKPDFVISSISLDDPSPYVAHEVLATIVVKNQGTEAGVANRLDVWSDAPNTQSVGSVGDNFFTVGTLQPGEERTFQWTFYAPDEGTRVFRAFVDSANLTTEILEDNNQATLSYEVTRSPFPPPPFVKLSPTTTFVSSSAGKYTILVMSNTEWSAQSNESWVTILPESGENDGQIHVSVEANETSINRGAVITVGGATHTLTQERIKSAPVINTVSDSLTISKGDSATLSVDASNTVSYQWYIGHSGNRGKPINGATTSTYTAKPFISTSFWVRVSSPDGLTANSDTILVEVEVPIPSYTLNVTATHGSVTRQPEQQSYPQGTSVTLTAAPADGYRFAGWAFGATGTSNPLTVVMNSNRSIQAIFELIPEEPTNPGGPTNPDPTDPDPTDPDPTDPDPTNPDPTDPEEPGTPTLPELWSGADEIGGGWYRLAWFGAFAPVDDWVFHETHGWLYATSHSDGLIYYDWELQRWAFSSEEVYPWIYWFVTPPEWVYFWPESTLDERWFYSSLLGAWRSE